MFQIRLNKETNKNIIVVSKKVIKKATKRNLIKRRIRSILYPLSKEKGVYFFVVVNSADVVNLDFHTLKEKVMEKMKLCHL